MHKFLIFSDSHGLLEHLLEVLEKEKDFDTVIHLGDIEGDASRLESVLSNLRPLPGFLLVKGNCDTFATVPVSRVAEWEGVRVFMTHGHRYRVNEHPDTLVLHARENQCNVALFGHTHKPVDAVIQGVHVFNPGSISKPRQENHRASYGVMIISDDGTVKTEHRFLYGE